MKYELQSKKFLKIWLVTYRRYRILRRLHILQNKKHFSVWPQSAHDFIWYNFGSETESRRKHYAQLYAAISKIMRYPVMSSAVSNRSLPTEVTHNAVLE
jgi:hypothetical protein